MVELYSDETTVTFAGNDHTTLISKFTETGGIIKYAKKYGFGNKVDTIKIGAEDWKIGFDVVLGSTIFYEIESGSPITTIVTLSEAGSPILTLTYTNAHPESLSGGLSADSYYKGTLSFTVPYYDETGSENRTVS